jgi:hypothetical protein
VRTARLPARFSDRVLVGAARTVGPTRHPPATGPLVLLAKLQPRHSRCPASGEPGSRVTPWTCGGEFWLPATGCGVPAREAHKVRYAAAHRGAGARRGRAAALPVPVKRRRRGEQGVDGTGRCAALLESPRTFNLSRRYWYRVMIGVESAVGWLLLLMVWLAVANLIGPRGTRVTSAGSCNPVLYSSAAIQ